MKNVGMKCKIIVTYAKKKFCYDKDNKSKYEVYRKVGDH